MTAFSFYEAYLLIKMARCAGKGRIMMNLPL